MRLVRLVTLCFLFSIICQLLSAETWFVRADGGTRHSSKVGKGQCDGKADTRYPGTGTNQHCAFNDVRFLWTDGSYTVSATDSFPSYGWIGHGGDTYIVRGGPWRVGQNGPYPKDGFGLYGDPYNAGAPPLPSGTAAKHTRLLGEHFENCGPGNQTQLFGGYGLNAVLDLDTAYADVQCLELTRHSQCVRVGTPPYPRPCQTNFPLDDYASNGIITGVKTHDLLLQDLSIHGFTFRGIIGAIGGAVTANRVTIAYNGSAGWDFDDGKASHMVNAVLNLSYVTVEWNGCNQMYPALNGSRGASSCYSQDTGGYGDGIGSPGGTCITAHVDHSVFRYNTQDGFDLLHNDTGNCSISITNSTAYGNNGQQFKWGSNNNPAIFTNNVVIGNCLRLSSTMPGQGSAYNRHLADFCRAQDTVDFNFRQGGSVDFENNTIISYSPTVFDIDCYDPSCSASTLTFKNNVVLGYDNPETYSLGGERGGPGAFYYGKKPGHINRKNNVYSGVRLVECEKSNGEVCADPQFVSEPHFRREQDLDQFNVRRAATAPVPSAGATPR